MRKKLPGAFRRAIVRRLVLPLLLGCLSAAGAPDPFEVVVNKDGTVWITRGTTCPVETLLIPETIQGRRVTRIEADAFRDCTNLYRVTIPDTVGSIGARAFYECAGLAEVSLGKGVTNIEYAAFFACTRLTSIDIPDRVAIIENGALEGCSRLEAIRVGPANQHFSSVDGMLFSRDGTALILCPGGKTGAAIIPDSVTRLGVEAFLHCDRLEAIRVGPANRQFSSVDGILLGKDGAVLLVWPPGKTGEVKIPESVRSIGDGAFGNCAGFTRVSIPDHVTSIGEASFFGCPALTNVTIGESVTSLGAWAFSYCERLTRLTIPDRVTSIGDSAFEGCTGLTNVAIGRRVTSLGRGVFLACESLARITIQEGVTRIGDYAFAGCTGLTSVSIPGSVTGIDRSAFAGCTALSSLTIPDSTERIGWWAFAGCDGLTNAYVGSREVGYGAFSGCNQLSSLTLGTQVAYVGPYAFSECESLGRVTFAGRLTRIGNGAFSRCWALTQVLIPDSVVLLGSGAFYESLYESVAAAYFEGHEPAASTYDFQFREPAFGEETVVYHPPDMVGWTGSEDWTLGFATAIWQPRIETRRRTNGAANFSMDLSVNWARDRWMSVEAATDLAESRWQRVGVLGSGGAANVWTDAAPPDTRRFYRARSLGWGPERDCPLKVNPDGTLTIAGSPATADVVVPAQVEGRAVTRIGSLAFANSRRFLRSVVLPNGITDIESGAFLGCTGLTNLTLPDSVRSIGDYAFGGCTNLVRILLGNGLASIGSGAFLGCSRLANVRLPDSVRQMGGGAILPGMGTYMDGGVFQGCTGLTNVVLSGSLPSIADGAFANCPRLASITLPPDLKGIGSFAFVGCTNLASIAIPDRVTSIGSAAFSGCERLTEVIVGRGIANLPDVSYFYFAGSLQALRFTGDAPSFEESQFYGLNSGTVHYLPGTRGWGPTFAGRPTIPWVRPNPTILAFGDRFGPTTNGFGFVISWATNVPVVVEACADMAHPTWMAISTNILTDGWVHFTDPEWKSQPARFYRVRGP